MATNNIFDGFNIDLQANTALAEDKYSAKSSREKCEEAIKKTISDNGDTALTWDAFSAIVNAYTGVFPSKSLYTLAFSDEKGKKMWADTEARWLGLQVISAVYSDEIGEVSADENKRRRGVIGDCIKGIYAYHGRVCPFSEIPKKCITTIGEYALKYSFIDWDTATSRALGVTTFIKTVFSIIEGYGKKDAALDTLKDRALRAAQKAQIIANNDCLWRDKPYPGALTQREKDNLEDKSAENS